MGKTITSFNFLYFGEKPVLYKSAVLPKYSIATFFDSSDVLYLPLIVEHNKKV